MGSIFNAEMGKKFRAETHTSACRKMKAIRCSLNRDFFMENPPPDQDS
jgi:hypothetical protein